MATLFDGDDPSGPHFDGETYEPEHDYQRLSNLLASVWILMSDGRWRTLHEIHRILGNGSEASISARLRDLRKAKFGSYDIERRRKTEGGGTYEYRMRRNRCSLCLKPVAYSYHEGWWYHTTTKPRHPVKLERR